MKWKVGDTTITKITEIIYPEFSDVIPAATPDVVKKVKWLFPHFVTPEGIPPPPNWWWTLASAMIATASRCPS